MKKLLLLIIAFTAFGCSNDDAPATVKVEHYQIIVMETCPGGITIVHEVDKENYDAADALLDTGVPCRMINFTDVNENAQSGYLSGIGSYTTEH